MKNKNYTAGVLSAMGMLICILDSKTALYGAGEGIQICIRTVIPSLFPFFVLSSAVTQNMMGLPLPFFRPVSALMKLPDGADPVLISAFLGGYPVGAQTIAEAVRTDSISPQEGARLLAFCNNAGPAFLFGIGSVLFPELWMCWALWGIHILSAIIVSFFFPAKQSTFAGKHAPYPKQPPLTSAIKAMAHVCGWIVMFRVMLVFGECWFGWLLPQKWSFVLTGVLELSLGCLALANLPLVGARFVLFSTFLGFGGICVMMQSKTVSRGIDFRLYLPGKLLHGIISCTLAIVLQYTFPSSDRWPIPTYIPLSLAISIVSLFILAKRENCGRKLRTVRV